MSIDFSGAYPDEVVPDPPIFISGTFDLTFSISKPFPSEAALKKTVPRVGMVVAWPYWREFVQSTASRMGLPGIMLNPVDPQNPKDFQTRRGKKKPE